MFLMFRDGTSTIQGVVVKQEVGEDVFAKAKELKLESSVILRGEVKEEPRAKSGFELMVKGIDIIQIPKEEYPIGKKEHGVDFLLENRHLSLRSSRQWAIQKIRDELIHGMYDFYRQEGWNQSRFYLVLLSHDQIEFPKSLWISG